jgi:hypothetical protein
VQPGSPVWLDLGAEGLAVMKSRSAWIWGGRIVALVAVALLAAYLWHVGLAKASGLASVLTLLVALVALVAPYLLPPAASRSDSPPVESAPPGPVQAGVSAPGDYSTRVAVADDAQVPRTVKQGTRTHVPLAGIAARKGTWVAGVMAFADMEDPDFRRTVLRQVGDRLNLGRAFSVPYRPVARDHVVEIVDRCWEFRDPGAARNALAETLTSLRPDDSAADHLKRILEDDQ